MRITIVMGFSLPMPPDAGGTIERAWQHMATDFANKGHKVTILSRTWAGWPNRETKGNITYQRLPGYEPTRHAKGNMLRDFLWSLRVFFNIPKADISIINCTCLPIWLGWIRRGSGKLVVMPARMPIGHFKYFRKLDCVLAASASVRDSVLQENSSLKPITQIVGFPINWSFLARPKIPVRNSSQLTIGYIGRIHREKGLDLLIDAAKILAVDKDLPAWRLVLYGSRDISQGGSGEIYATSLHRKLAQVLPPDSFSIRPPVVSLEKLAAIYRQIDIFCYPSISPRGETFGVAVAEAMASSAVPVVSQLPCFAEYIQSGENGESFDHTAPDASERLASILKMLLVNPAQRFRLSENARASVYRYDYPLFASRLLADFATMAVASK